MRYIRIQFIRNITQSRLGMIAASRIRVRVNIQFPGTCWRCLPVSRFRLSYPTPTNNSLPLHQEDFIKTNHRLDICLGLRRLQLLSRLNVYSWQNWAQLNYPWLLLISLITTITLFLIKTIYYLLLLFNASERMDYIWSHFLFGIWLTTTRGDK